MLSKYLGIVFIAVVILPAVVLSLLAIRSIGREEIYIQTQLERTLSAEIDHVAGLVGSEIDLVREEIAAAAGDLSLDDPAQSFAGWKTRSRLVDIPFLLSSEYQILWPSAGPEAATRETEFVERQQAFLRDEAKVPVYENVAAAYKEDILGGPRDTVGVEPTADGPDQQIAEVAVLADEASSAGGEPVTGEEADRLLAADAKRGETSVGESQGEMMFGEKAGTEPEAAPMHKRGGRPGETRFGVVPPDGQAGRPLEAGKSADRDQAYGEQSKRQAATSLFLQSEPVREKTYRKAEEMGQQISYRNVEPTAAGAGQAQQARAPGGPSESPAGLENEQVSAPALDRDAEPKDKGRPEAAKIQATGTASRRAPSGADRRNAEDAQRLRSIFVSQPLRLSEIVARGPSGVVPLTVDGEIRLLYWQRAAAGKVIGCLVAAGELRDRIIGSIPSIYSASRILTVLDEKGRPLIVPQGQEDRDWRKPFVAQEISEALPGWEAAAYLVDPGMISSRARLTTSVMWILIFIMFVSIVAGGVLVLRSASAELKLAQQKTTFVANVSHELKTPLTSIRMFAEMLKDGRQPDERKRQQYFSIMTAETERLTRLINNVLDFARAEQGKKRYAMRDCDLAGLAASIVESQRARLENNGFRVIFTSDGDAVDVRADEEAVKQALINLLSNAEKYSDQVKEIEVGVAREGGAAVVSVSDRGVGIPPGEAERIFTEFYRVDDALTARVKGSGLGLTIARRIARDHGGDIAYSARDGGGSTFKIVLPLKSEQT